MKLTFVLLLISCSIYAQNTQNIRGVVTDKESKYPLIGVTILVTDIEPKIGASTNESGEFKLENVPYGRHIVQISYIGYKPQTIPNIELGAGKETVLDIQLEENIIITNEVVINGYGDKTNTNSEMALISARSFNLEEANRYAGSLNDPARMAANYAGVGSSNDSRNDIVVRGNSPLGILWRLEGIEIPNPNHFGSLGATGGPVSMLNANQLAKSDFFTGAFPANFGNANSGVFDLQMRRGNNEKREHLFQIGFNGLEAGTEGPFSKKSKASYLINYRYSTLGLISALGMKLGTGGAVPFYQDVNFKIDIPTQNYGKFVFFGLGGLSSIDVLAKRDTSKTKDVNNFTNSFQDVYYKTRMGIVGLSHTYFFNPSTSIKTVFAASYALEPTLVDSVFAISNNTFGQIRNYEGDFSNQRISLNISINKKINKKHYFNTGINIDRIGFALKDQFNVTIDATQPNQWRQLRNSTGTNYLYQAWFQHQFKISSRFTLNTGLHAQHFSLNNANIVEPRVGMRFQATEKSAINFGAGLHNQTQMQFLYYNSTRLANGSYLYTNTNLGFTSSLHFVLGYDHNISKDWRIKFELYYQNIFNVPVEQRQTTFSALNIGGNFSIPTNDSLVNNGRGYNYGVEFTIEKFFSNGFYLLQTTSLFSSKYRGSDYIWRNTTFNGGYIFNILGGYELNTSKKTALSLDLKTALAGGRWIIPIDVEQSKIEKKTILDTKKAYTDQLPLYFRLDIKFGFRLNGNKVSHQWGLSIQNLTNHFNAFNKVFNANHNPANPNSSQTEYTQQLGLLIIPQYRLLF